MTANPLQELAEKIFNSFPIDDDPPLESTRIAITKLLTASVGTLLQAERAAIYKKCYDQVDLAECSEEGSFLEPLLNKFSQWEAEAASALTAVVQRETEKLQKLIGEAASELEGTVGINEGHQVYIDGLLARLRKAALYEFQIK